jgi:hypothetical protein
MAIVRFEDAIAWQKSKVLGMEEVKAFKKSQLIRRIQNHLSRGFIV